MPGGGKYRQWYALRARLRAEGRWEADTGRDTRQRTLEEVGVRVPPKKQPRLAAESDSDSPPPLEGEEGDPNLGDYATDGKSAFFYFIE